MLATVLAAVAVTGGFDTSKTCSKFVSVSSSFDGVMFVACSEYGNPAEPGVVGLSMLGSSSGIGGGRPGSSTSTGSIAGAIGSSVTIS